MLSSPLRAVAACLFLATHVLAASSHQRVEELGPVPDGWTQGAAANPNAILNLRLAVHQPKAEEFEKRVIELSTPGHPTYGRHMKREEVRDFLQPEKHVSEALNSWLRKEGIPRTDIEDLGDWIKFRVPVSKAEKMLDTRFYNFHSEDNKDNMIRTLEYSVPEELASHVHMIQPTTRFGQLQQHRSTLFKTGHLVNAKVESDDCIGIVTPSCIRKLYRMDKLGNGDPRNKLGISGYLEQYARYEDFAEFLRLFAPEVRGKSFEVESIHYGKNLQNSSLDSGEASLDIQYGISLSNASSVYYTTGGRGPLVPDLDQPNPDEVSNEPYLDQLFYLLSLPDHRLPTVLTTSYGENEQSVPAKYTEQACRMFAQLGARGVSVIFSSGDDGPGSSCQSNDRTKRATFNPIFPAGCPFVTSVGATLVAESGVEEAVYFSAGGFSDRHPRPKYQDKAVDTYLDLLGDRWDGLYNPKGRGFPDVAALGRNFSVYDKGEVTLLSGTRFVLLHLDYMFVISHDEARLTGSQRFRSPLCCRHLEPELCPTRERQRTSGVPQSMAL